VRGAGPIHRSRASAQVLSLESKAKALSWMKCGDGGIRVDSLYIDRMYYHTSATTASYTIRVM